MADQPPSDPKALAPAPARAPAQDEAPGEDRMTCGDCVGSKDPQPAAVFCGNCGAVYCIEHDAAFHTGHRSFHKRVPVGARPAQCPVHSEEAMAYCMHDKRFACKTCIVPLPPGPCHPHLQHIKTLDEAAAAARTTLEQLARGFQQDEEGMQREADGLMRVRVVVDERLGQLQAGMRHAAEGKAKMRAAAALQARDKLITDLQAAQATAGELQTAIAAAVGETATWLAAWKQRCDAIVPYTVRCCMIVCVCVCVCVCVSVLILWCPPSITPSTATKPVRFRSLPPALSARPGGLGVYALVCVCVCVCVCVRVCVCVCVCVCVFVNALL
jgi:hypothetical protein